MGKEFKIGDKVRWTSQAGGHVWTKVGRIVCVVPAENRPDVELLEKHYPRYNTAAMKNPGMSRGHDSFIVCVLSNTAAKDKLYWPRVSALELVPEF